MPPVGHALACPPRLLGRLKRAPPQNAADLPFFFGLIALLRWLLLGVLLVTLGFRSCRGFFLARRFSSRPWLLSGTRRFGGGPRLFSGTNAGLGARRTIIAHGRLRTCRGRSSVAAVDGAAETRGCGLIDRPNHRLMLRLGGPQSVHLICVERASRILAQRFLPGRK